MSTVSDTSSTASSSYPELLSDMADQAERLFIKRGIAGDLARSVAWDLVEYLRTSHWAKQTIYFPEAVSVDARRRAAEMFERFNGHNMAELAQEFDVSLQHAYRMIRFVRAEMVLKRQGRLFAEDEPEKPNLR